MVLKVLSGEAAYKNRGRMCKRWLEIAAAQALIRCPSLGVLQVYLAKV
jgi:hypothetical protein